MSNKLDLYDTHAHFNLNPGESAVVMTRALEAGVRQLVAVGGSQDLNAGAIAVAEAFEEVGDELLAVLLDASVELGRRSR